MMARKKKNNLMLHTQNTAFTSGNVKIHVYKGDKFMHTLVQHNSGTKALCYFVASCLSGDMYGENILTRKPDQIVPCKLDSNSNLKDVISGAIPSTKEYEIIEDDDNSVSVVYSFIIPSTIISAIGSDGINGFRLYSEKIDQKNKSKSEFAWIKLDEPLKVQKDTNLRIEWTIKVSFVKEA